MQNERLANRLRNDAKHGAGVWIDNWGADMNLQIEYPEGYELADSKPRHAKYDEYYMDLSGMVRKKKEHESAFKYIILKKKAPEYYVTDLIKRGGGTKRMIDSKALADALDLPCFLPANEWNKEDKTTYNNLKELLK